MRRYRMLHEEGRESIDLRKYKDKIIEEVKKVIPFADVQVEKTSYTVDPSPYHSQAIKIGKALGAIEDFQKYCVYIARTFYSVEVVEEVDDDSDAVTAGKEDNTVSKADAVVKKDNNTSKADAAVKEDDNTSKADVPVKENDTTSKPGYIFTDESVDAENDQYLTHEEMLEIFEKDPGPLVTDILKEQEEAQQQKHKGGRPRGRKKKVH